MSLKENQVSARALQQPERWAWERGGRGSGECPGGGCLQPGSGREGGFERWGCGALLSSAGNWGWWPIQAGGWIWLETAWGRGRALDEESGGLGLNVGYASGLLGKLPQAPFLPLHPL